MVVAADGSGDFKTLQSAVDAIQDDSRRTVIYVRPGVYREKLNICKKRVSLVGESAADTVVTFDDGAYKKFPDGQSFGTFNSYTVHISGNDFTASNITFENTAGDGDVAGQAIAASVLADRAAFYHCRFLGCQDTLFTGPLPPEPMQPDGFKGPDEHRPRNNSKQYYFGCFIQGDIDFIFGSATAVFDRCEIYANERGKPVNGYLTAASTPADEPYGYVFLDCTLTGDAKPGTYYLGRPWRDWAKTVFLRCHMGEHIRREGFDDWGKTEAACRSVYYAEHGCRGPGACVDKRPSWVRRLTEQEAANYTVSNILTAGSGWVPREQWTKEF